MSLVLRPPDVTSYSSGLWPRLSSVGHSLCAAQRGALGPAASTEVRGAGRVPPAPGLCPSVLQEAEPRGAPRLTSPGKERAIANRNPGRGLDQPRVLTGKGACGATGNPGTTATNTQWTPAPWPPAEAAHAGLSERWLLSQDLDSRPVWSLDVRGGGRSGQEPPEDPGWESAPASHAGVWWRLCCDLYMCILLPTPLRVGLPLRARLGPNPPFHKDLPDEGPPSDPRLAGPVCKDPASR